VRKNGRQRRRESETVRKHVLSAGLSQLLAEPVIAVENLPDDGLGAGRIDVTFLHGGTCGEPSSLIDVRLQPGKIGGIIFLHEAVSVGAAKVEYIVRIFIEQLEIIFHRSANIFIDHLRIFPSPFRIEVSVADHVEGRLFGQVGLFRGLGVGRGEQHQEGNLDCH
jgi:hypothetical protein